ncbi:MAG: HAMP domain-containing histidine kinase [Bryobacterales bacterium]|nr:HAMP domain-containing histidine kinase [Bryobacterales bacterium]
MSEDAGRDLTLRGLIHDLNNVFQTILDAADLLAQDPKWAALAGNIERTAERGHRLSQSISEATRSTFPLGVIADIAIQFARDYLYATKHHPIEFQSDVPASLRIRGNPVAWERILVNLLLNSAQAMPCGGWVKLAAAQEGSKATVRLEDNGPGIPVSILSRIFEPHFSTKPANSGIGLHIVKSLVELDGGAVAAENRPEGGAAFVIEARC